MKTTNPFSEVGQKWNVLDAHFSSLQDRHGKPSTALNCGGNRSQAQYRTRTYIGAWRD